MFRRVLVCAALLLALSFGATEINATESLSVHAEGNRVEIKLANPESARYSGVVRVLVNLESHRTWAEAPFTIDANGTATVTVKFDSPVIDVTLAGITEGPDPIPQ